MFALFPLFLDNGDIIQFEFKIIKRFISLQWIINLMDYWGGECIDAKSLLKLNAFSIYYKLMETCICKMFMTRF